MNNYIVYSHIRLDTNEIFYIGKGKPPRAKITNGRNDHWKNIVKKAGGFSIIIEAKYLYEEEALNYEKLLIRKLREVGVKLCNITDGGEGMSGYNHTEESRKKMSESHIGLKQTKEHILNAASSRVGRACNEETRNKLRIANAGTKPSEATILKNSKPVRCITTGIEYKSIRFASISLGLYAASISMCCRGIFKQTKGLKWEFITNIEESK